MKISEVGKQCNLSQDTLRYYEKEGLIGPIQKTKNGIRDYTQEDLKRIEFVKCMRDAGLEVLILKQYMDLYEQGDHTIKQRRELLMQQKEKLEKKLQDMQKAYDKMNYKIDLYDQKLLEKDL